MVISLLLLLKHFLIYHINQLFYKFSQKLLLNLLTITSKSLKKNNTKFTFKSTQTHPLTLSQLLSPK